MKDVINGNFGQIIDLKGMEVVPVYLSEGVKKLVTNVDSDLIDIRKSMTSAKKRSKEKLFK